MGSTAVGNLSDIFSSSIDRITESIEDIVLYVAGKFKFVNRICVMKKKKTCVYIEFLSSFILRLSFSLLA